METKPIGLYVHIPFCIRKCNYCDFCSIAYRGGIADKYIEQLISEIRSYTCEEKVKIDSIFFGGGTPSVLGTESFERIVFAIREAFDVCDGTEFSVEVNPATLTRDKADAFVRLGVNRISIGLQSIHEKEMKKLGRIHTYDDFLNTFRMAREAGISNINVDLMYGIPYQTEVSFAETLRSVIALSPEHISAYGLIVEEGTQFYTVRDSLPLPDEDAEYGMYISAAESLSAAGFEHYEISNYAKAGFACRHNLKYWHDEEYIGVGLSAHSYYRGKRYSNTESFDEYFDSFGAKYRKEQSGTVGLDKFEYAMLALRLSEGLSLTEYSSIFGEEFAAHKGELLERYIDSGYLCRSQDRIYFSTKGFYVSNAIMAELL